jgi:imidazolonepropionase-like amidohydrolase
MTARSLRALAAFAAASLAFAAPARAERVDLIVRHASVVDVSAERVAKDRAVAVRDGKIVEVGGDRAIAARYQADRTLDAAGGYLMPGLWDMHMHFGGGPDLIAENKALLPIYIAFGITTVRDCAADISPSVLEWRAAVASGALLGPTIFTSGPKLEGPKPIWKGTIEVDSPADVEAALDRLQTMGADFVKITDNTLKPDIFLYALGAAKKRGLRTSAHVPYSLMLADVVAAGLNSVEHGDYLMKAGSPQEAAITRDYVAGRITGAEVSDRLMDSFDPALARVAFRKLAKQGLFVTPTLNMGRIIAYLDRDDHSHDPMLALIGPRLRKTYDWRVERAAKVDAAAIDRRHRKYALSTTLIPLMRDAGITIMAGTDAGYLNSFNYPGQGLHDELARYVESGLTPAQALRSATLSGPAFFRRSAAYGAIAKGRTADLLLLDANPLDDIAATRRIRAVVAKGRLHDRAELDRMLSEARAEATK